MISRRADAACFVRNLTRPWAAADLTPAQCGDRLVLRCLACGEHTNEERGVAAYSWTRRSETAWGCRRCWPSKSSMTEAFLAAGLQAEGYQVEAGPVRVLDMDVDLLVSPVRGRRVLVELDSKRFHSGSNSLRRDFAKTQMLIDAGYRVIRLREDGCPKWRAGLPKKNAQILTVPGSHYRAPQVLRSWLCVATAALSRWNAAPPTPQNWEDDDVVAAAAATAVASRFPKEPHMPRPGSLALVQPEVAAMFVRNVHRPGMGPRLLTRGANDRCEWSCGQCQSHWTTTVFSVAVKGTRHGTCVARARHARDRGALQVNSIQHDVGFARQLSSTWVEWIPNQRNGWRPEPNDQLLLMKTNSNALGRWTCFTHPEQHPTFTATIATRYRSWRDYGRHGCKRCADNERLSPPRRALREADPWLYAQLIRFGDGTSTKRMDAGLSALSQFAKVTVIAMCAHSVEYSICLSNAWRLPWLCPEECSPQRIPHPLAEERRQSRRERG